MSFIPSSNGKPIRVSTLLDWKQKNHKWAMLTCYDFLTAKIFQEADVPVLLVGDSAANVVYGYDSTLKISVDELIPLVRAVSRGVETTMVVADLPFGSFEQSPAQALETAVKFMQAGAHAVKIEGGQQVAQTIRTLTKAGIPVMGHLGFTPQSIHTLGGYKIQGKTEDSAKQLMADAKIVQEAGAFGVVLEMVPAEVATKITETLDIPTIGIGAGNGTDGQVLVWQDMAGVNPNTASFVKQFAKIHSVLLEATKTYIKEVSENTYPDQDHSF